MYNTLAGPGGISAQVSADPTRWAARADALGLGMAPDTLKALTTVGADRTRSTHAMIGESLDPVVKVLTARSPYHTPFLTRLRTRRAFSTVEEFNRLTSLGDKGSFMPEGALPREATSQYERAVANMRFAGQTGVITGPMMAAARAKFGNMKSIEMVNRTNRILLDTEDALFWGNSSTIPYAFDGVFAQIGAAGANHLSIDLRGKPIDTYYVSRACRMIWQRHGVPTLMMFSPREEEYVSRLQNPHRRIEGTDVGPVTAGMVVNKFKSPFGLVDMIYDLFLAEPTEPRTEAAQCEDMAPPVISTVVAAAAASEATSKLPAGSYTYSAAGINMFGEGPEKAIVGTVDPTAGQKVTVTIPSDDSNSGYVTKTEYGVTYDNKPTAYKIYRGLGSGARQYVTTVAWAGTGVDTTYVDLDTYMAGTTRALVMSEAAIALAYLQRLQTFDLARVTDAERFMIVQYLGPLVYAPQWIVEILNIGEPPTP